MTGPKIRVETADTEAASWHARLGARSVSAATLEAFFAWRSEPLNDDAYRRVERLWESSGKLAGDPQIEAALQDALNRQAPEVRPRRLPRTLVGLAALGAAAVLAFGAWSWVQARTVFSTATGEQRVVQLADGSTIRLDTDSRIRVRFNGDRRRIDLEAGQALFTVVHDTARPFIVDAGSVQVTAVGTVFDVQRTGAEVSVTLVSGVVDVAADRKAPPARMAAGHQARVSGDGVRTRPVDAALETSWTEGRIVFRDTPLREAVVEVNRYLTARIELVEGPAGSVPINGVFRTGDRDAFVSTASEGLGLEVRAGSNGAVILSERKNN